MTRPGVPVAIAGTGAYLPDRVVTNAEIARRVDTSDAWIVERTGIRERRILDPSRATSHMAVAAATAALRAADADAADVDAIVVATMTPDRLMPCTASLVEVGLARAAGRPLPRAWGFDLNAACSGFVEALAVGEAMVSAGRAENALVVGADALTRFVNPADRATCVLFGDGAGAVLLRPAAPGATSVFLGHVMRSEGALGDILEIPAGGSARPPGDAPFPPDLRFLRMEGREVFKVGVRGMADASVQALQQAGLTAADVALFVPHQANLRIMEAVARRVGIPLDRMVSNVDACANTTAGTIPIALDEAVRAKRLRRGDVVLLAAAGGGITYGATVLVY